MSFSIPISGGALGAFLLWIGGKAFVVTSARVKKWDKHCIDDDLLHAVIEQKLTDMDNRLKSVDSKMDRLVDHMIEQKNS